MLVVACDGGEQGVGHGLCGDSRGLLKVTRVWVSDAGHRGVMGVIGRGLIVEEDLQRGYGGFRPEMGRDREGECRGERERER